MTTRRPLPNEILLRIIDLVNLTDVLDLRLTCSMFRSHIDTGLAYNYLRKAELICCVPSEDEINFSANELVSFGLSSVCHDADVAIANESEEKYREQLVSHGPTALFTLREPWREALVKDFERSPSDKSLRWELITDAKIDVYHETPQVQWIMRLAGEVIDISKYMTADVIMLEVIKKYSDETKTNLTDTARCSEITVKVKDWRSMIRICLREICALHWLYDDKKRSSYSYNLREDALRYMHRKFSAGGKEPHGFGVGWCCRARGCQMRNLWGVEGTSRSLDPNEKKNEDKMMALMLRMLDGGK